MADTVGTLQLAALRRKERLAALRNAQQKTSGETNSSTHSNQDLQPLPKPLFRSYQPEGTSLKDFVLPESRPSEVVEHIQEELSKENEGVAIDELDFLSLAPRKPDWDLKRDIAPKLEKLERRTQKAIAELIRERLKEEDLANAVTAGASAATRLAQDDD